MSVRFITGRNGSNREKKILDISFEKAKSDVYKNIFILVPEKYTYEMEKLLSERYLIDRDENFKIRIVSFSTLSKMVFTNVGGFRLKKLTESTRRLILHKAIFLVSKELKTFNVDSGIGIVDKVMESISEFKTNNFSLEIVEEMISKTNHEALKLKLKDLALIYRKYEELIADKFLDVEDSLDLFSKKLSEFEDIKDSFVFVHEYDSFTPSQLNVIEALILNTKDVYFSFNLDFSEIRNMDVFYLNSLTLKSIIDICKENRIKVLEDIKVSNDNFFESEELSILEREITKFKNNVYDVECDNLKIYEFKNTHLEVEYIALKILELVRSGKYRFNEITVASRNLEDYDYLLNRIFDEYKIEYFLDKKLSSKSNPIITLLFSILEMKRTGYSYNSVFRYLKSGLLNISYDDICVLENFVLENGISGKKWFSENFGRKISYNVDGDDIEEEKDFIENIRNIRDKVFYPIIKLHDKLSGKNTVREICRYIYEFTLDISLREKINEIIENFTLKEDLYKAKEYGQVWNVFVDVIDEMVNFIGEEKIGIDRFISLFETEFDSYELGIIPISMDKVFITSTNRMKNPNSKVVFLLGVNDGLFPKVIIDDGLLNDLDKKKLLESDYKFLNDSIYRARQEDYLVYKSFSTAKEKLFISYSISDFDGKSLRPSSLIKKLKSIFKNLNITSIMDFSLERIYGMINSKELLYKFITNGINKYSVKIFENEDIKIIYDFLIRDENYKRKIDLIIDAKNYKNEVLDIKDFTKHLYKSGNFSVSRLEKFSSCPFSYFINYGLKTEDRKIFEFTPMDSGNYAHKVLDTFSKEVLSSSVDLSNVDINYIRREVEKISKDIFNLSGRYILDSDDKFQYMSKRINENLSKSLDIVVEQIKRGDFTPTGFETSFGFEEKSPITFNLSNGKLINLIGKIDRIDIFKKDLEEYIRIIDYKSSSKDLQIDKILAGLQLQLFIYMRAILEMSKKVNRRPSALLYSKFNLNSENLSGFSEFKSLDELTLRSARISSNKFSGFYIDDIENVFHLDRTIEEKLSSEILPISLKKDGTLKSNSSRLNIDEFDIINTFVFKKAIELCEGIYSGNIEIKPYRLGLENPCTYCRYKSICRFDVNMQGNSYKNLPKCTSKNREEFIDKMKAYNEKGGK